MADDTAVHTRVQDTGPPPGTPDKRAAPANGGASKKKSDPKAGKNGKKGKKDKKGGKEAASGASVAGHPRAVRAVRRAKGFGGLAGFALAALLSHSAGLAPDRLLERALIAGVGGYLLAWACAVTVWRHIVLAELKAAVEAHEVRRAASAPTLIGAAAAHGAPDAPEPPPTPAAG